MIVTPVTRDHRMTALGNQINKSIFTYSLFPSVDRCIRFQPGKDFFQQSCVLSGYRSSLTLIQVQYEKFILNGKLTQFTGLYRHNHQCFIAAFIFELRPCLRSSLASCIIFHGISCFFIIFLVTDIHNNRIINMRSNRCYDTTLRIMLNIRQDISVEHSFQLNSHSVGRTIIITCQFQSALHPLFVDTHIFECLLRQFIGITATVIVQPNSYFTCSLFYGTISQTGQ